MPALFNVWATGQRAKTTIIASEADEAKDRFCQRHGYIDLRDYCVKAGVDMAFINVEQVGHVRTIGAKTV